ncbi:hypothetical protein BDV10DRAFT_190265 [Aspergillus recurvatus]
MQVEQPYSVHQFNTLPSLNDATDTFMANNGPALVLSSLWDLFYKHNVTEVFGPTLIHRHFDLKANQAIVDVNGTSTPWTLQLNQPETQGVLRFTKYGGRIQPCAWIVSPNGDSDGQLMPFEFYFEPGDSSLIDTPVKTHASFMREFASVVLQHGMAGVIGLRLIRDPERRSVEVTEGFANVTFPFTSEAKGLVDRGESAFLETGWKYPLGAGAEAGASQRKLITRDICHWQCVVEDNTHGAKHTSE